MLYKIRKKTAGAGIILMNIFTILIFLLVIFKILPYNSISGGRLDNYQAAFQTSIISIFIMIYGIPIIALASSYIKIGRFETFFKAWLVVALLLISVLLYESTFVGVFMVGLGVPLTIIASGIIKFKRIIIFFNIYLWFSFILVCLNTIANLFGQTLFEKIIMSLVTVAQAIFFFRLATDKDLLKNTN